MKTKDVGALLRAYPTHGLSHRLDQDKQLESAHAKIYCRKSPRMRIALERTVYNTPDVDVSVALSSGLEFARFVRRR